MYKVTVIGAGDRGGAYMNALRELGGGVEFASVCDILADRQEKAFSEYGFKYQSADWKEAILNGKPDIVVIATPAYFHCDMAKFAMENGAHVMTEKPFDLSLEKCFELKEVSEKTGKKLAIGLQYRNTKYNRTLKNAFERNLLGRPYI